MPRLSAAFCFLGLALAGSASAATVALTAADGTALSAEAVGNSADKGVVLVHMLGRTGADWKFFSERLEKSGLRSLAVDLRGHGSSAGAGAELAEGDHPKLVADVQAAVAWLRKQGAQQISCVGASIGANLCLQVAAQDPGIVNVVALSPGLNYKGVTALDALGGYGERPLLLVASEEDRYSAKTALVLDERAAGQHHFELLQDAGHGTKMLNRASALEGLVLSWLLGTYELGGGEVVVPRPASGGAVEGVATEGEKLDSHR